MHNPILTETELRVLEYLEKTGESSVFKIANECISPASVRDPREIVGEILNDLKEYGFINGTKASDTGWVFVKVTTKGRQFIRNKHMNKTESKIMRSKTKKRHLLNHPWIVGIGTAVIAGTVLFLIFGN